MKNKINKISTAENPTKKVIRVDAIVSQPLHYIALGAGVQSSTMALMATNGELKPMPEFAVFADTQHESKAVYKWLDYLKEQVSFPIYKVTAGDLEEATLKIVTSKNGNNYTKSAIPAFIIDKNKQKGLMLRQCTGDYKITPLNRFVRSLIGKNAKGIQWMGISIDEITRMKDAREKWKTNYFPLIENNISRYDCIKWMKTKGYPEPPRSACIFCPYHSNKEWLELKDNYPDEFTKAIEYEKKLKETMKQVYRFRGEPFLHNSLKNLEEVSFENDQMNLFENECEGLCGV
jgi:hypothetical protein